MRIQLLVLGFLAALSTTASAQYQPNRPLGGAMNPDFGQSGPTVSPYINLLRNNSVAGGSTLVNYYGLVRPELQFGQQVRGLAEQQGQFAANGADNVPTTGAAVRFMNTQPYFQSFNRGGGGGAAQGVVNNQVNNRGGAINANNPFGGSGLNGGAAPAGQRNQ